MTQLVEGYETVDLLCHGLDVTNEFGVADLFGYRDVGVGGVFDLVFF